MKRALLSVAFFLGFACDPVEPPPPVANFDTSAENFTVLLCEASDTCFGQDPVACTNDVTTDLNDAQDILDDAGEALCIACLDIKAAQLQDLLDAACDINVLDNAPVLAVCDLDPAVDFDGNGTTDDDANEACAGFP